MMKETTLKEKMLEMLKDEYSALKVEEIANKLGLKSVDEIKDLNVAIDEAQQEYDLYLTKKNKYILYVNCPNFRKGTLSLNKKGFGFVIPDNKIETNEEDIYIPAAAINKALDDDYVLVEIVNESRREGKILKILHRDKKNIVGEIKNNNGHLYFEPYDSNITNLDIPQAEIDACVEGEIVCVVLSSDLKKRIANIKMHVGHKDDPKIDILAECAKFDVCDEFPEEVMKQVAEIPQEVLPEDKVGREDLTDKMIFTIDGADTKDIDDAISVEVKDGYYYLGVHIADVTYYVLENSPLDLEAYKRGTSTYPASFVIPMLPHELSNGICSLNEGKERLAMSCFMKINSKGEIVSSEVKETVIKSRKKMTYDAVNSIIERNETPEGYEEFEDTLKIMQELAHIIRNRRTMKGASDFDTDEIKVVCDQKTGRPLKIVKRERGEGEKLIEDFMVAANEAVASLFFYMMLPLIYRCHDLPSEEKLQEFIHLCTIYGIDLPKMKSTKPKEFQKLLDKIDEADPELAKLLKQKAIRVMAKARYQTDNIGHYGLALENYAHFTSPIRRLPDDEVHRAIRTFLIQHKIDPKTIEYYTRRFEDRALQSSEREKASQDAERAVDKLKMAEYMNNYIEEHPDEELQAVVSDVHPDGLYVVIDGLNVEGLIPIKTLGPDFVFSEDYYCIISKGNKTRYSLGNRLSVKCTRASKADKKIDFELVKDLTLEEDSKIEEKDVKKLVLNNGRG